MKKIIIFGNSGAGKSTLAKFYTAKYNLAHLDLDTVAWSHSSPPQRRELQHSLITIEKFLAENECWVVEGCYSDLLGLILDYSTEIIYLDIPIDLCIKNAKSRPWEPHKYDTKEAQDKNLHMLIEWIKGYEARDDHFSKEAHNNLFNKYTGKKSKILTNSLNQSES